MCERLERVNLATYSALATRRRLAKRRKKPDCCGATKRTIHHARSTTSEPPLESHVIRVLIRMNHYHSINEIERNCAVGAASEVTCLYRDLEYRG